MSPPDACGPVRTCVGCRRRRPVDVLVRITRSSDGITVGGSSDGRGAWLCLDETDRHKVDQRCVATAIAKRAFARAWRTNIDQHDEENIREHATSFGDDSHPDIGPPENGLPDLGTDDRESNEVDRGRTH